MSEFQNRTAYQQNLQRDTTQPQQQGPVSSTGSFLANIEKIREYNPQQADEYMQILRDAQGIKGSKYYNPYTQPTNKAFGYMQQLGVDMSGFNNDSWFTQNAGMKDWFAENANTNNAKAPTKKSSTQERIGYNYNELYKAKDRTSKALLEEDALWQEIQHWVAMDNLNLSDDEIMGKIDWNKYSTLRDARDSAAQGQPIELNAALNLWNDDSIRAAIWMARNPDDDVDIWEAMAKSATRKGNVWKQNPEITKKLSPTIIGSDGKETTNPDYAPYSVGFTNLDQEALYFGVTEFTPEWIKENEWRVNSNDKTEAAFMQNVIEAKYNQEQADKEYDELYKYINTRLKNAKDPKKLLDTIDWNKYPTLAKMDQSMGQRNYYMSGKLVPLTKGIDYRYANLEKYVEDEIAKKNAKKTSNDTLKGLDPVKTVDDINAEAADLAAQDGIGAQQTVNPEDGINNQPDTNAETSQQKPTKEITLDELRKAYDAKYGEGAYDHDTFAASAVVKKTGAALNEDALNDKVASAADVLWGNMTPNEQAFFTHMPGVQGQRLANAIYSKLNGPVNQSLIKNSEWIGKMAVSQARKAEDSYVSTALSSMDLRTTYEKTKEEAEGYRSQLNEANAQYGSLLLAREELPEEIEISFGENFTVPLTRKEDGTYEADPAYLEDSIVNPARDNYLASIGISKEEYKRRIEEGTKRWNDHAKSVEHAKANTLDRLELSDLNSGASLDIPFVYDGHGGFTLSYDFDTKGEEVQRYLEATGTTENELWQEINAHIDELNAGLPDQKSINAWQANLDRCDKYLSEHTDEYNQAVSDLWKADNRRNRTGSITLRNSGIAIDPSVSDDALEKISWYGNWEPPAEEYDSLVEDLNRFYGLRTVSDEEYQELTDYANSLREEAKDVRFLSGYYDGIPDQYKNGMTGYADWLERRARIYDAYTITKEKDFKKLADEGRLDNLNNMVKAEIGFSQMTTIENDIYFALYKKFGLEKATQFYKDIEGNLAKRATENVQAGAKEFAESGFFGRVFNETFSIASSIVEVPLSIGYAIDSAINGEGSKWWRLPSKAAKAANEAVIDELHSIYKGTFWDSVIPDFIQMINDRGRSMMVSYAFGGFFPKGTNDIVHSFPIATIAMADKFEEAMDRNLQPWQAWTLATATFLSESITEGIEFGHYKDAFPKGISLESYKDFFLGKVRGLEWLSEGIGETTNNIVERAFDNWVAGEGNRERDRRIQEYLDSGKVQTYEDAELMVMMDEFKEDIHTFTLSSLSTFLDLGTFTAGKLKSTLSYANEAQIQRKKGNVDATVRSLRNRDMQAFKTVQEIQERNANRELRSFFSYEQKETGKNPANVSKDVQEAQKTEYDANVTVLENSLDSDPTTVTNTIRAVLRVDEGNDSKAGATSVALSEIFGDDTVSTVQNLLIGGRDSGTNINSLKLGIQYAALADGECRRVLLNSASFKNASPARQAQMLSEATQADANNENVKSSVNSAVHEFRVNTVMQELMSQGHGDEAEKAQQKANDAAKETLHAKETLEAQQDVEQAKNEARQEATQQAIDNPTDENTAAADQARREYEHAAATTDSQAAAVPAAENRQNEAESEAEKVTQDAMTSIRQQAEDIVSQQEQQEAQREAEARAIADKERAEAEAKWQEQSESEAEKEKELKEKQEQAVREYLSQYGYKGEHLERQVARVMGFAEQSARSKENMQTTLSEADGDAFIRRLERQTGMHFSTKDLGDPLVTRGFYDRDSDTVILNKNLTKGLAVVEAALHEITHGIEDTKAYSNYSAFVLNAMYGGENTKEYKDALKAKIDEYTPFWNQENKNLTPEEKEQRAKQELVAEYGRLNLAQKGFVRGLAAQGLGEKFRSLVSQAISRLRGYTLDAAGRAKYQELRTAYKLLNEAINERAQHMQQSSNGHTGILQASITGWADATGLTLEVTNDDNHVYKLMHNGQEIKPGEYKAEMVEGTPVGNLINMANMNRTEILTSQLERGKITRKQFIDQVAEIAKTAEQQRQYVAQIINMIGQYQDAAMVWELAGSLAFSSLKTNGDPQYSDSYDFGTICTKTQAILNAISETQVRLGRALTKEEIDGVVYNEVGRGVQDENGNWKHGATPCPPCYVYATWVNKPARLEKVRLYQEECSDWTDEQITEFMNKPDPVGRTKSKTKELRTEQNTKKLWIKLCLADEVTNPETGETTWVRKENPDICPNDILLDLRRSGDMATHHPGTWTFMQKGGNAQGKAIAPYSDARLGESIVAKAIGAGEANARLLEDERNAGNDEYIPQFLNPFLSTDPTDQAKAKEYFEKAIKKIKAQNLKGGQRWQSWSDFRAEWGSDYLMEMITMQALGSQVQTYTKVTEALDLLASAGFEVNMSLMPHGDGFWHNEDGSIKIDEDGNMMLRFSPVTGINPEAAEAYARKYGEKGNVQPMVVGISDEHITAALAGDYITFVIPFHGSGGSVKRLQHLMSLLHEQMKTGNDYTKAQSDEFEEYITEGEGKSKKKINTNPNWALREKILTGECKNATDAELDAIYANPFLKKLYEDRYINEDSDAFEVFFSKSEAQQIYPYEYWDTNTTLATADINSQRFIEYCQLLGVKPRFSGLTKTEGTGKKKRTVDYANFSGRSVDENGNVSYHPVKGYWKLLIDRSMYNRVYDENGKIIPEKCTYHKPQAVSTADINIGAMPMAANNTVGHSDDDTRQITERIIQQIQMKNGQNAAAGSAVDLQQNADALNKAMNSGSNMQASRLGDLSQSEVSEVLRATSKHYDEAVERGDMEAAQQDVDFAAEQSGYTLETFHGTGEYFNVFERRHEGIHLGNREVAEQVAGMRYESRSKRTDYKWGDIRDSVENMNTEQRESLVKDAYFQQDYFEDGQSVPEFDGDISDANAVREYADSIFTRYEKATNSEPGSSEVSMLTFDRKTGNRVMRLYAKINNPYVVNGDIGQWSTNNIAWMLLQRASGANEMRGLEGNVDITGSQIELTKEQHDILDKMAYSEITGEKAWDALSDIFDQLGFDGIQYLNTYEGDKNSYSYIALNQSDVKLADPVTYDDQGNVIPLEERFNQDNLDIRYSRLGDISKQEAIDLYKKLAEEGRTDEAIEMLKEKAENTDGIILFRAPAEYRRSVEAKIAKQIKDPDKYPDSVASAAVSMAPMVPKNAVLIPMPPHTGPVTESTNMYILAQTLARLTNTQVLNALSSKPRESSLSRKNEHRQAVDASEMGMYQVLDIPEGMVPVIIDNVVSSGNSAKAAIEALGRKDAFVLAYARGKATQNGKLSRVVKGLKFLDTTKITDANNNEVYISFDQRMDIDNPDPNFSHLGDLSDNEINSVLNDLGITNAENVQTSNMPTVPTNLPGNAIPESSNLPGTPGMLPQRQFGNRTAQQSDALHQEVKDYLYAHSSYIPDTNHAQIDRAVGWVQSFASENDPDGYYAALNEVTSDSFDYRSADGQARMLTVMSMAALKAENGDQGALQDELRLADAFNRQGTDLGRQLQARKIFRMMTPVGRQAILQKMVDQINEQYGREGRQLRIGLSNETLQAAANAQTEEDFQRIRHAAARELADQMPANWKDKLRGWRMLSMLGNPRTHIRNVIGNAMFIPAVGIKNKLGAITEIATRQKERTKTLSPFLSKEARSFARQDAIAMKDILTGEAKYNENSLVEREQKPFRGLLQAIIDFNSNLLEKEDWAFLKGHYRRALGGWMQANGYTAEQLKNNQSLLDQGRAYAVQEAQKSTYRDFSKLAQTLNQVSRQGGVAGFLVDATLPFKKTPANILKRGVEYSPAGIMRSLTVDLYHLKQYNDYKNGKLSALPEKALSPNQFIDRLCSGLSGTAIMAVGALLGHAGIVTCGLDDDDDKFEKEQGNQKYSIKFSIAGHDYTYTVDWAAPMSMPFFVGAAIQEQMANQKGFDIEQLVDAFGNITEPVFNLSMLDGVNSLFKTSQYDDTNTITQIGAKIASNYVTSYVPSLLGSIARTIDNTSRKAFVKQGEGTGVLGTFRYAREQVENKIPGLSQTNIPVRDVFGNAKTSSLAERIIENFISPGYISEYKNDPVLKEMDRLYNANVADSASMIPKDPGKTVTYEKVKYVLNAEEWDAYKAERGQTAYGLLTELINNQDYKNADDDAQVQMIKGIWDYADKVGKKAIIPDFEMEDSGIDPVESVIKDGKVSSYNASMMKALEKGDYEGYDTMVEALHQEGVEDKKIKEKIGNKYRDLYKKAYKEYLETEDDQYITRMTEIEELLTYTGLGFDLNKWEEDTEEELNQ